MPPQPARVKNSQAPIILDLKEFQARNGDACCPEARVAIARDPGWQKGDPPPRRAWRQVLEQLLGQLPGFIASDHSLVRDKYGAPRLTGASDQAPRVSLAHSGPWFAVGLSRTACIGVDIEQHARQRDFQAMADYLGWQRGIDSAVDFYSRWTLWEAYVKCTGNSVLEQENAEFRKLLEQARTEANSVQSAWRVFQGEAENRVQFAAVLRIPFKDSISCKS